MSDLLRWPTWMPRPLRAGYGGGPVDRRTKTDMEIGGLYRVEFDTDETQVTAQVVMEPVEAAYFEKFETEVLQQGSTWFTFPLWLGGRLQDAVVRFAERPQISRVAGSGLTFYTFTLDVKERDMVCDKLLDVFACYGPRDFKYCAATLDRVLGRTLAGVRHPLS